MLTTKVQIQDDCVAPETADRSLRKTARRLLLAAVGIGVAVTALPALAVTYSDGTLDKPFFTVNGTVETDIGSVTNDDAWSLAIQSDGKIVVAGVTSSGGGNFAIVRYNTNGSLDTSFDTDGKVSTDVGTNSIDAAYSVAIQNDGKIVVAGSTATATANSQDVALLRYNTDGSLDSSFDTDGKVTTDVGVGKNDSATAVVIQSDGKIIIAGIVNTTGTNSDYSIVRYNIDGSLDTTFDTDGMTTVNIGDTDDTTSLAIQSDGKIVIAGTSTTGMAGGNIAAARLLSSGGLDITFDTDGKVSTDIGTGTDDYGRAVVIQGDGKIVVVGKTDSNAGDFALVRYNTDGSLDTTFDVDGKVTTNFAQTSSLNSNVITYTLDAAFSAAIQDDGKVVVAGQSGLADFGIARYNADGSLDTTFGTDGKFHHSIYEGNYDVARSVAIQNDGKIVAAGYTEGERSGNIGNFGVARYGVRSSTTTTTASSSNSTITTTTSPSSSTGATSPSDKTILSLSLKDIVDEGSALPGSSVTVDASGFTPQETVAVGVLGSKSSTKTLTANASGSIKTKVTIPKSAKKSVTVYAYGQSSKHGYRDTVNITHSSNLPGTGTNSSMFLFVSLLFLCPGILIITRRQIAK